MLEPSDHFCRLYDDVDARELAEHAEAWRADPATERTARWTEIEVLEGRYDSERVDDAIAGAIDPSRQRIGHLRGLDLAMQEANPALGLRPPRALAAIIQRYNLTGRYNTDAVPGGLVPRYATPGRQGQLPDTVGDLFAAVQRVPAAHWDRVEHVVLPMRSRIPAPSRRAGVVVACVPMVEDPDEMSWEDVRRDDLRFYRIAIRPVAAVVDRIRALIRDFDLAGVEIAVLPELVASRELLDAWTDELSTRRIPPSSRLRWVLVGTGDVEPAADRPVNAGVLLDGRTGEALVSQRKQHAFNIKPDELHEWRLPLPHDHQLDEDIRRGDRLTIAEAGLGRLAILVCEDLARVVRLGPEMAAHGVSHALAPVFSKPTLEHYWEHSRAKVHADETGASVIVVNSLVVGRLQGISGPSGASLVHTPWGASARTAERADELMLYRIRDEVAVEAL